MGTSLSWQRAATPLILDEKKLHIWRASLDLSPTVLQGMANTLNLEEKERAAKFLISRAGERFIAGRAILRELLGMYLELSPDRIDFAYGSQGKPSLSSKHHSNISFSVSHSQGMGLFAFARVCEVGVDIEEVKLGFKGMEIASHFFSEREIQKLAKLAPGLTNEAFFECWTGKEAYVKARGEGLALPLRDFTIEFLNGEQVLRDEVGRAWSCYALKPMPGFAGAVVAAGEGWSLCRYQRAELGIYTSAASSPN